MRATAIEVLDQGISGESSTTIDATQIFCDEAETELEEFSSTFMRVTLDNTNGSRDFYVKRARIVLRPVGRGRRFYRPRVPL